MSIKKEGACNMKLSYEDIERIAENELIAFTGGLVKSEKLIKAINIEDFAVNHLGLRIVHTRLSDKGDIIGLTTYVDTNIELRRYNRADKIHVLKATVILDESLRASQAWQHDDMGHIRFTVAHECGHQIIYRMIPESKRASLDLKYSARTLSPRQMKSLEDWSEWQANALASAILMPKRYIALMLNKRRLTYYGKRLNRPDRHIFYTMCRRFGVSATALRIRLEQLGYLQFLSSLEYSDPTDIVCSYDFDRILSTEESNLA
jgi:hypothetical protein